MSNNIKLNKVNNIKMNPLNNLTSFFILIIVILIIYLISTLFIHFSTMRSDKISEEYDIQTPLQGNAKNMNLCPSGCYRGFCQKGKGECKYDFQCEFCADKKTNTFYVEPGNNTRQILPLYEEENHMNNKQKSELNVMIEKNNNYINELNKRISMINDS